jgi:Ser/Thr protein kinase RdoA (MazF antagonist)
MASSMAGNSSFPGELVGSGRADDVYALDAERVLRRYRTPHSCAAEAALMRYLRAAGYPVPEVLGADGPDLVMEGLHGREMLADMAVRALAVLHDRLHDIPAAPGLPHPLGPGKRILHLNLHPGNVMLTADGPVVIDWTNASAGPPGADVAMACDHVLRTAARLELPALHQARHPGNLPEGRPLLVGNCSPPGKPPRL